MDRAQTTSIPEMIAAAKFELSLVAPFIPAICARSVQKVRPRYPRIRRPLQGSVRWRNQPRVNPGLCSFGHFGPRITPAACLLQPTTPSLHYSITPPLRRSTTPRRGSDGASPYQRRAYSITPFPSSSVTASCWIGKLTEFAI
jgi:hypothetical protein